MNKLCLISTLKLSHLYDSLLQLKLPKLKLNIRNILWYFYITFVSMNKELGFSQKHRERTNLDTKNRICQRPPVYFSI